MSTRLPVLFVSDLVVLPGMVVPVELDEPSQAAIDAARASSDGRLLVAPRLEDCLLYTSPSPRDLSTSRMPSSA